MNPNPTPVPFDAYDRSLQLLESLVPVVARLRAHDPDLVRQLRRAALSVQLNIAEARGRVGGDRRHLFRVAYASAGEVAAALEGAVAFALVSRAVVAPSLALVDRVRAMTYRLSTT